MYFNVYKSKSLPDPGRLHYLEIQNNQAASPLRDIFMLCFVLVLITFIFTVKITSNRLAAKLFLQNEPVNMFSMLSPAIIRVLLRPFLLCTKCTL